jgi:flagellin
MTSIMTNAAAMAALQTLRDINNKMDTTQQRISSGYRVETASDNAAYWSIATTMRSDNKALSTVQDALGLGAAKTDTAYTGLESAIDVVTEIKAKLVAAREPGVDKVKINEELRELKNQLQSIAESASFSGENWLFNDTGVPPTTVEMVGSFNRASDGTVAVETLEFDTSTSTLIDTDDAQLGILTADVTVTQPDGTTTTTASYFLLDAGSATAATGSEILLSVSTSDDKIDGMISAVDAMLGTLTDSAATLGFGRLVDADMNEESTRLKALQTQQQLGIQSLSIANSNAENILQLFK